MDENGDLLGGLPKSAVMNQALIVKMRASRGMHKNLGTRILSERWKYTVCSALREGDGLPISKFQSKKNLKKIQAPNFGRVVTKFHISLRLISCTARYYASLKVCCFAYAMWDGCRVAKSCEELQIAGKVARLKHFGTKSTPLGTGFAIFYFYFYFT